MRDLKQFDDAWRRIGEATTTVETTKERSFEAELHRVTGEKALKSPSKMPRSGNVFRHSLAIARRQQPILGTPRRNKPARLWRDQGEVPRGAATAAPLLEEGRAEAAVERRGRTSARSDRRPSSSTTELARCCAARANRAHRNAVVPGRRRRRPWIQAWLLFIGAMTQRVVRRPGGWHALVRRCQPASTRRSNAV